MKESVIKNVMPLLWALKKYHRHEVKGMDNIPLFGPVIILTNHSLATYDGILLGVEIYLKTGRLPYGLGDTNLFTLPLFRKVAPQINMVEANHQNAEKLLHEGEILAIAPGGMREALRPTAEKGKILWTKRKGFAKLSVHTQVPIVLAACPLADDIYHVSTNLLTKMAYKNLKLPFVLARGVGPTLIPRPTKLTHYLSAPLFPPKVTKDDPLYQEKLLAFHHDVLDEMEKLMKRTD